MQFLNATDIAVVRRLDTEMPAYADRQALAFDALRREVKEIRVGGARYRLRCPVSVAFYPHLDGAIGRLTVRPALLSIRASGANLDEAWQSWVEQFHVRFQTLLARRPWEMSQAEQDEWVRIEQLVDVPAYQRETPWIVRQIGWLTRRRPVPDCIRWEDGRHEYVRLHQMPPEFATLHEGERFEAEVERDSLTRQLLRVVVLRRLPPLRASAGAEAVWSSLPRSTEAPVVEWDEIK